MFSTTKSSASVLGTTVATSATFTKTFPANVADPSPSICAFTLSSLSLNVVIYFDEVPSVALIFNP